MLATLGSWDQPGSLPESIISIGGYPDETDAVLKEREYNCRIFTKSQREAIAAYLKDLSLEWYWDRENLDFAIKRILEEPTENSV
jgi:hypothetical protein